MKFPKYKAGPAEYWFAEAATVFINGFIAGLGGASLAGIGVGVTQANTALGDGLSAWRQIALSLATLVFSAAGNGCKRVIIWHDKNQFPNPYPKPEQNNDPTLSL